MTACAEIRDRLQDPDERVLSHLESCEACAAFAEGEPLALPQSLPEVPRFDAQRLGVESAMAGRQRRAWARRMKPFAAAAAVAAIVTAGPFLLDGSEMPRMLPGEVLVSHDGPREVLLPDEARLVLETGRAALEMPSPNENRVRLDEGVLSLRVPKLQPGQVLSVQTRDALVRVRGTQFRVAVEKDSTRVSVSEGLVEVLPTGKGRDARLLRIGDELVVPSLESYRTRLRSEALEALGRAELVSARVPLEALLATEPEAELGAEIAALRAFVHRSAGESERAAELYRRFLDLLPAGESPVWAQDACVERALLVNTSDAWRECLERFPDGRHATLIRSRVR